MSSIKCKGLTKSGDCCKRNAGSSGYCSVHDPNVIAKHEAQKKSHEIQSKFEMPTKSFSERHGFKPVSEIVQIDGLSQNLRNSLWNVLYIVFSLGADSVFDLLDDPLNLKYYNDISVKKFFLYLWVDTFKKKLDGFSYSSIVKFLGEYIDTSKWYEVYDFLEITINYFKCKKIVVAMNIVLARELSCFRFVGGVLTDITTQQEIEMLEEAIEDRLFNGVSVHLKRALTLMSDRNNPDYRNSIKESISAVESLAKEM